MEKSSVTSPKKGIIILSIIAAVAAILFGVIFGLMITLNKTSSMYNEFSAAISDPYAENYIEDEKNFQAIRNEYKNSLTDFSITSQALENRLNFYLPYLIHIKFNKPTQKTAKKLLNEFNAAKNAFSTITKDTNDDCLRDSPNPHLYYGAFLPQYKNYINAKYNLVKFIEGEFQKVGFVFSDYLNNLNALSNLYVELSINLALPSIYVTNGNTYTLSTFINNNNQVSLGYLNGKFLEFKNTFKNNANQLDLDNFNSKISEIKKDFYDVLNVFFKLSVEKKEQFLKAPKILPSTVEPNSEDYEVNLLLSYFATFNGKFKIDTSSSNILNYFNF